MSALSSNLIRGLKCLERTVGNPKVTYGGNEYPCTPSSLRRGTQVVLGGMAVDIALTLYVRVAALPEKPPVGTGKMTYNSAEYRVASVVEVAGGSHYEIDLADKNR